MAFLMTPLNNEADSVVCAPYSRVAIVVCAITICAIRVYFPALPIPQSISLKHFPPQVPISISQSV